MNSLLRRAPVLTSGIVVGLLLFVHASFAQDTLEELREIRSLSGNTKALIFVHGVLGDPKATWTASNRRYWPALVADDQTLRDFDIFVFAYYSPKSGTAPSLVEVAQQLNSVLEEKGLLRRNSSGPYGELYFVTHSMGALIVRQATLSRSRYEYVRVPLIVSIAAPSAGAELAQIARMLSRNPTFAALTPLEWNEFLKSLDLSWWEYRTDTEIVCAYETLAFPGLGRRIVEEWSAKSVCTRPHHRPFTADHSSIAKPVGLEDARHGWLRDELRRAPLAPRNLKILLMDSPLVVYDEALKKEGKMNSHVIQEILREIGLRARIVPVERRWDVADTEDVVKERPDLIVIHWSSFAGIAAHPEDLDRRLAEFVRAVLSGTRAKVLIYTRWPEGFKPMESHFFERFGGSKDAETVKGRVYFLDVRRIRVGNTQMLFGKPTFAETAIRDALVREVKTVLGH